jgi:transcriptional regulator with XRE-family HTH domain
MTTENEYKQECGYGDRIKKIRKELNLKQKDFAARLNMSSPSLSEIETGKYKPGYDFLISISKEFNVNLYYVLFGEGDMFIDPILSSYRHVKNFAVNIEDVHDFLYYFERSSILQYFILNQFKTKMVMEKKPILKEIEEYELKRKKKKNSD